MATYKDICPFRVGDLVTTKPGYGYKLYTNGIESFTRKQTSGIVLPANDAKDACDCLEPSMSQLPRE